MQGIDYLALVSRWVHVGSFIGLVGGAFFMRSILVPSATEALSNDQHDALRGRLLARWKRYVHAFIALLLVSGAYNVVARWPAVKKVPLYHGLLTVKILLALFVMFVASALVGRSKGLEGMRNNRKFWMTVNLWVAAVIVLLSGFMRYAPFAAPAIAP